MSLAIATAVAQVVYDRGLAGVPAVRQRDLHAVSISLVSFALLVHRVISKRHTAVGQLADFQGGPSRTGG